MSGIDDAEHAVSEARRHLDDNADDETSQRALVDALAHLSGAHAAAGDRDAAAPAAREAIDIALRLATPRYDAGELIVPWLLRLRHHWRAALAPGWIPRVTDGLPADRIAVDVLTRLPVATDLIIRRVLSANGAIEKFDKLNLRAPGPALSLGGIDFGSGLRWAMPTELISNLAWTSSTSEPDFDLVSSRLTPQAADYPAFIARSRQRLSDAVELLRGTITAQEFNTRWPVPQEGVVHESNLFDLSEGELDFIPAILHVDNWSQANIAGEQEDVMRLGLAIPSAMDRLVAQQLEFPETPEADLQSIRDWAAHGMPAVPRLLAWLNALEHAPAEQFLSLTLECLDVYSHRWDSWATSLATSRLDEQRAAGTTGVRLGGYGWVENLRPGPARQPVPGDDTLLQPDVDGYIHAPSLHHAATAAVLRSGYRAHGGEQTLAVNLTSRRARVARWLLGGVRRGQNLGALLGYRFERALHDAHLDEFKAGYRADFPAPVTPETADGAQQPELWSRSTEAIAARNVVDGMALARAVRAGGVPVPDVRLQPILDDLVDALDAVGDLLLGESVHQLVGGNAMRAGIAADTLGQGEGVPDRFDVLRTPHRGRAITHRIAAILPADAPRPAGWATDPFAQLEPRVDSWAAGLLGPAAGWALEATLTASDGTDHDTRLTLDEVELSALALVVDAAGGHQRLDTLVADRAGHAGAAVTYRTGWDELNACLGRANALLAGAQPLQPAHVLGPEGTGLTPDLPELADRIATFAAAVATPEARSALGIAGDPARLATLTQHPEQPGWLTQVNTAVAELLGTPIPLVPLLAPTPLPAAAPVVGSDIAEWIRRYAAIRPTARTWHETLLLAGARSGRPGPLIAWQSPTGGAWIGGTFDPTARPPARQHLIGHLPTTLPDGGGIAGVVFDEWAEVLPGSDALSPTKIGIDPVPAESELTGLAFHFDRPDAKAPQAILLAVPPDPVRGWTADVLAMVVRDTLELAKLRAVDLGDLPLLDDILPAFRTQVLTRASSIMIDFWTNLAE